MIRTLGGMLIFCSFACFASAEGDFNINLQVFTDPSTININNKVFTALKGRDNITVSGTWSVANISPDYNYTITFNNLPITKNIQTNSGFVEGLPFISNGVTGAVLENLELIKSDQSIVPLQSPKGSCSIDNNVLYFKGELNYCSFKILGSDLNSVGENGFYILTISTSAASNVFEGNYDLQLEAELSESP